MLPLGVVALDVVEDGGLEHEEGAVDPAFLQLRLLGELDDPVAVQVELAEAGRRPDGGHGGQLAVGAMELQQLVEVDSTTRRRPR